MKTTKLLAVVDDGMIARFWGKVNKGGGGECWIWVGRTQRQGYGIWALTVAAHRLSYELINGAIPDGLVLDHLCRNPSCVNPNHLEPVTVRENIRRGFNQVSVNMRKTRCPRGHPLVLKHHPSKVERSCDVCAAQRARNRRLNRKILDGFNWLNEGGC